MKTMLKAWDSVNNREISKMVGKAMCAYANHKQVLDAMVECTYDELETLKTRAIALQSEYEATIRCINMFVREDIYEIQQVIKNRAERELLSA